MAFVQPIFLWALAGLSIPIAIHLLSKKEGKIILLGSIRHVRESSTQQFKSIRLNGWLLLLLRCLMLVLWVMLLSGLYMSDPKNKQWVVVEKSVKSHVVAKKWIDSLQAQGFELHWLADDFPTKEPTASSLNYWESISILRGYNLQKVVVLSSSFVEQFVGMREPLPYSIQWITLPTKEHRFIAEGFQKSKNDYWIRQGKTSSDATEFQTIRTTHPIDSLQTKRVPQQTISIAADDAFEKDARLLNASLVTIEERLPIHITIQQLTTNNYKPTNSDWLFWLSNKKLPAQYSGSVIFYQQDTITALLKLIRPNQWAITKRLSISVMQETNFTLWLASLIIPEKEKWKDHQLPDSRSLPDLFLQSNERDIATDSAIIENHFNYFLFILLLLVLLLERWIAYRKNQ